MKERSERSERRIEDRGIQLRIQLKKNGFLNWG